MPLPTWSVPLSPVSVRSATCVSKAHPSLIISLSKSVVFVPKGDYDILADSPPPTLPPAPSLGAHGNESGSNELVDPQIEVSWVRSIMRGARLRFMFALSTAESYPGTAPYATSHSPVAVAVTSGGPQHDFCCYIRGSKLG